MCQAMQIVPQGAALKGIQDLTECPVCTVTTAIHGLTVTFNRHVLGGSHLYEEDLLLLQVKLLAWRRLAAHHGRAQPRHLHTQHRGATAPGFTTRHRRISTAITNWPSCCVSGAACHQHSQQMLTSAAMLCCVAICLRGSTLQCSHLTGWHRYAGTAYTCIGNNVEQQQSCACLCMLGCLERCHT